jgi:hypothetical protein
MTAPAILALPSAPGCRYFLATDAATGEMFAVVEGYDEEEAATLFDLVRYMLGIGHGTRVKVVSSRSEWANVPVFKRTYLCIMKARAEQESSSTNSP